MNLVKARLLIGGELVDASDGSEMTTVNPANERVIGFAANAGAQDVAAAVGAGEAAWPEWASIGVDKRSSYMRALAAGIRSRKHEIAKTETRDTGNLFTAMLDDVERAAARIEFYAGLGHAITGTTYPATPTHLHLSEREPFGTVGRIVAFNHPFYFQASRLGAPLIAGNSVVMKSPDQAPLSGGILAEICQQTLPAGVVNILSGSGLRTGDALVRDPRVKRIGFIGSVNTALAIQRAAAEVSIKHITHELGGKNMMVVMADADVERAADLAIAGMNFEWQGQSCGSTSCLMLHDAVYDAVMALVEKKIRRIKVGDPFDADSGMGPLISAAHYEKVNAAVEKGVAQGATLLVGGERPKGSAFAAGYWIEPTLFADVTAEHALSTEEIFGPVLSVMRWSKPTEILEKDNLATLGLTASVIGRDVGAAIGFARRLRVGYVWINCVGPHYTGVPYGGFKNSGVGREEGLEEIMGYTDLKSINILIPPLS
ncbi:aldehyde dehydrogenase family protein [Pigmentiphaga litoralis]|uniref:aldehyde dehydrogenase family protein n=1 Tax=Pigmentiphaga litoralis TaxID=516702 RepID=UPI00389A83DB